MNKCLENYYFHPRMTKNTDRLVIGSGTWSCQAVAMSGAGLRMTPTFLHF